MHFQRITESLFPTAVKVTGFIFLICGTLATFGGLLIAPLIALIGLFVCFGEQGIIIDFQKKMLKEYWGIFSLRFGKWEKIPPLRLVTIVNFTQTYSNNLTMGGAQSFSKERSCRVNLKGVNPRVSIVASSGNLQEAIKDAEELAERFKLDIFDCTGPEKKRIKIVEG